MADEKQRINLAVSLHSAVDETRTRLMPINRKFGLRQLMEALEYYYRKTKAAPHVRGDILRWGQ
jgi:23S rRNA (adenine2503-C2)-methyltransferase